MIVELQERLKWLTEESEAALAECRAAGLRRRDIIKEADQEKKDALVREKNRRGVLSQLLSRVNSADSRYRAALAEIEFVKVELRKAGASAALQGVKT